MRKPLLMRTLRYLLLSAALMITIVIGIAYLYSKTLPSLSYWHLNEVVRNHQLLVDLDEVETFEQYMQAEQLIFQRLKQLTLQNDNSSLPLKWNRYAANSALNAEHHDINWNKSFVLTPKAPRAGAVLVHGLSDSPYSLRKLAQRLAAQNIVVVGLRVPGHGTLPAALREPEWEDFRHALLLATEHLHNQISEDMPFFMVGYSNGSALITDYSLLALDDDELRIPDQLVMLSPAMQVSGLATFARAQRLLSDLPKLDQLAWVNVTPEYDPYKYNSFPVAAAEQIYQLTQSLQQRLKSKKNSGQLKQFPPVLAFQSVVDATIPPQTIMTGLMNYLKGDQHRLVLFDVNSASDMMPMLKTKHKTWLTPLKGRHDTPFALTIVANQSKHSLLLKEQTKSVGNNLWQENKLSLQWPASVYSLSHVALPFAPDDHWYGSSKRGKTADILQLGAMTKRGERGVFGVSMDQLSRLRYNPFYSYMEAEILNTLDTY